MDFIASRLLEWRSTSSLRSSVYASFGCHSTNPTEGGNDHLVGDGSVTSVLMTGEATGFRFLDQSNYRDVGCLGNTDDSVRQLATLLGWSAHLDALVEKSGGWPPPGPALEDVRPRRKAISKKTVAAAAKVFQSILGGGKRTGSPVLPAGLSRTGSPVGGRSSAASPASVSSRSCGSASPAGGWKVGDKGRLAMRGARC